MSPVPFVVEDTALQKLEGSKQAPKAPDVAGDCQGIVRRLP